VMKRNRANLWRWRAWGAGDGAGVMARKVEEAAGH